MAKRKKSKGKSKGKSRGKSHGKSRGRTKAARSRAAKKGWATRRSRGLSASLGLARHRSYGMSMPKQSGVKVFSYKNGDVFVEKLFPSGMYVVTLRGSNGEVIDKVRSDDYREAMEYKRAFVAIAKNNTR